MKDVVCGALGGVDAVRDSLPVQAVLSPLGSGVPARAPCVAGAAWTWDGVRFRFLHPGRYFPYLGNEASCVLKVETAHGSLLLPGDIGAIVERGLVHRDAASLRADVVVLPHHGSAGSSDPAFVAATSPPAGAQLQRCRQPLRSSEGAGGRTLARPRQRTAGYAVQRCAAGVGGCGRAAGA